MKNFTVDTVICFLLTGIQSFSQSNYERGFRTGYNNGSCFEIEGDCKVALPKIKGKAGKYRAGYSYGFEEAVNDRRDASGKKYFKDYYSLLNEVKYLNYNSGRENSFIKTFDKIKHLYLIGDYERCISLSELLAKQLDRDYRTSMFVGLSLIELEDFKQGEKLLKIAAKNAPESDRQIIEKTLNEVASGTYKSEKIVSEGGTVKQTDKHVEKPATVQKVNGNNDVKATTQKTKNAISPGFLGSGRNKFSEKDYAGAVADLTKAIDENASAQAYYLRALAKDELGDAYGASNDFSYLVKAPTHEETINYTDVYLRYSNILSKQKKYALAITQLDALIKMNDKATLPLAYYNRGIAKINNNDKEGGCADLSKAGELGYKESYEAIKKFCA